MDRVEQIRARCEAATPGPWVVHDREDYIEIHDKHTWGKNLSPFARVENDEFYNAAFIAHAREDIPYLLDQLAEAHRREKEAVIDERDKI